MSIIKTSEFQTLRILRSLWPAWACFTGRVALGIQTSHQAKAPACRHLRKEIWKSKARASISVFHVSQSTVCCTLQHVQRSQVYLYMQAVVNYSRYQGGHNAGYQCICWLGPRWPPITATCSLHSGIPVDIDSPTGVKGFLSCCFPLGTLDIYFLFSDLSKCIYMCYAYSLSRVQLFATPWTIAYHAPLSMGFSRQENWSGLPCPPLVDLPNLGNEPRFPTLQVDSLPSNNRKSRNTWSNRQMWPWNMEWSRAKTNRVLPRKCTGHSKYPISTTQEKTWTSPDGQHRNQIDYVLCSQRWRSYIQSTKTRPGADCGSDYDSLLPNSDLNWRK